MNYKDCVVLWQPKWRFDKTSVMVLPRGVYEISSNDGCYMPGGIRDDLLDPSLRVLVEFNTLVVRDGIDPQQAHNEFLKIDEYRAHVAPDTRGAQ